MVVLLTYLSSTYDPKLMPFNNKVKLSTRGSMKLSLVNHMEKFSKVNSDVKVKAKAKVIHILKSTIQLRILLGRRVNFLIKCLRT